MEVTYSALEHVWVAHAWNLIGIIWRAHESESIRNLEFRPLLCEAPSTWHQLQMFLCYIYAYEFVQLDISEINAFYFS